jgi:hypothetical protein
MNLHGIVSPCVAAVNPMTLCMVQTSTGYTTNAAYQQVPQYATFGQVPCQIQPLSGDDLKMLDGLNLEGTHKSVHVNGQFFGANRPEIKGGDLFTLPDLTVWLVVKVLEAWDVSGWCHLAITQQNGS